MFETIRLQAQGLYGDIAQMSEDLDISVIAAGANDWLDLNGDVFDLACLVERFESGNWDIQLDEIEAGHDHTLAAQKIDQYTV